MHYGKDREVHSYSMKDGDNRRPLRKLEEEKDLGVLFDSSLTFRKHVGAVTNKANRIVGVMKRTFEYMDIPMFKTLYKTMIRPHLEYANCVWSPFLKGDINKLEKVQRRATKLIPEIRDQPYEARLKRLKLISIQKTQRRPHPSISHYEWSDRHPTP
ncbi:uncharacterized protein [Amphiura filiformis]|uniref:uncharacterized protein n=1 Tax=Amphiura filiformis TaxID=82378 RepID=UPI003B20DB64